MCLEVRGIFFLDEPLASVMDVIAVVLQGQSAPFNVVEAGESGKHLLHDRHVKQLLLRHRQEVDLLFFKVLRRRRFFLTQIEFEHLKHDNLILLSMEEVDGLNLLIILLL